MRNNIHSLSLESKFSDNLYAHNQIRLPSGPNGLCCAEDVVAVPFGAAAGCCELTLPPPFAWTISFSEGLGLSLARNGLFLLLVAKAAEVPIRNGFVVAKWIVKSC